MRKKSDHELVESQGGKYALVVGVTRRARELMRGDHALVQRTVLNSVAVAIDELAQERTRIVAPSIDVRRSPLRQIPDEVLAGSDDEAEAPAPAEVGAEPLAANAPAESEAADPTDGE